VLDCARDAVSHIKQGNRQTPGDTAAEDTQTVCTLTAYGLYLSLSVDTITEEYHSAVKVFTEVQACNIPPLPHNK
jgi:hypothetical protein